MKTVTLKLTDVERDIIEKELRTTKPHYKNDISGNMAYVGVHTFSHHNKIVTILNVDKFREFLNNEIKSLPRPLNEPSRVDYNIFKSILSKLDKEVK